MAPPVKEIFGLCEGNISDIRSKPEKPFYNVVSGGAGRLTQQTGHLAGGGQDGDPLRVLLVHRPRQLVADPLLLWLHQPAQHLPPFLAASHISVEEEVEHRLVVLGAELPLDPLQLLELLEHPQ